MFFRNLGRRLHAYRLSWRVPGYAYMPLGYFADGPVRESLSDRLFAVEGLIAESMVGKYYRRGESSWHVYGAAVGGEKQPVLYCEYANPLGRWRRRLNLSGFLRTSEISKEEWETRVNGVTEQDHPAS